VFGFVGNAFASVSFMVLCCCSLLLAFSFRLCFEKNGFRFTYLFDYLFKVSNLC
jgi:hypothetical protein